MVVTTCPFTVTLLLYSILSITPRPLNINHISTHSAHPVVSHLATAIPLVDSSARILHHLVMLLLTFALDELSLEACALVAFWPYAYSP